MVASTAANAQQQLAWNNYCTNTGNLLCSSVQLDLTPDGTWTDWTIRLRNLEGSLGTTPYAMFNMFFTGLSFDDTGVDLTQPTNVPKYSSQDRATLADGADMVVTADAATCLAWQAFLGGCPGPSWGVVEWDRDPFFASPPRGGFSSHIDDLPRPFGIVGCDVPAQPDPSTSYWGAGYFQTCNQGWVIFQFAVAGSWTFDAHSRASVTLWDADTKSLTSCVFGQTCVPTTATPEPGTLSLALTGLVAAVGIGRRTRRRFSRSHRH
jgi:hypothetical protein